MKKIFMVCYGGGHVNIVKEIYHPIKNLTGAEVTVLALTTAPEVLSRNDIPYIKISDIIRNLKDYEKIMELGYSLAKIYHDDKSGISLKDTAAYYGSGFFDLMKRYGEEEAIARFEKGDRKSFLPIWLMEELFKIIKPDLVITTTSPRFEKASGIAAANMKIPNIRINDLPVMDPLDYDCTLCVMNQWASEYAQKKAGISEKHIVITGQPAIEATLKVDSNVIDRKKVEFGLNDKYKHCVVFFSQNGIDQTLFYEELNRAAKKMKNVLFVIKLHPNQSPLEYDNRYEENVKICNDTAAIYLNIADLAITTFSTTGLEAALLGKPLLVIDRKDNNSGMDYVEMGIAEELLTYSELSTKIEDNLNANVSKKEKKDNSFQNRENSAQNIAILANRLLS